MPVDKYPTPSTAHLHQDAPSFGEDAVRHVARGGSMIDSEVIARVLGRRAKAHSTS